MSLTDFAQSGVIGADGVGEFVWVTGGARQTWVIQQCSGKGEGVGFAASCAVYRDGYLITAVDPHEPTAAGEPYITLRPGQRFSIRWTGATPGAAISAMIIYDDGNT